MIKLNFEDWKMKHIEVCPNLVEDMQDIHGIMVYDEIDKALETEYAFYENIFNDTLRKELHKTVISVTFKKVDGSERTMLCTLNPMLIPKDKMPKTNHSDASIAENEPESPVICVFEVDLQAWRSFRKDNIIEWHINQATDLGEDA